MLRKYLRPIALAVGLAMTTASFGCGYILHPERRGNRGGTVDGMSLLFDLLWLIPGLIPGIVALIVDFTSGAIYVGGRRGHVIKRDGQIAIRLPKVESKTSLELRLVTVDGRVLDRSAATLSPDEAIGGELKVDLSRATRLAKLLGDDAGKLRLELRNDAGKTARMDLEVR